MPQRVKQYTPEEYYCLERKAEFKSDFYDGEIFAMAGASARHNKIVANIISELQVRLRKGPCETYASDMRLKVAATALRTYPDVSVYCDHLEADQEDAFGETFTNPTALFEVLSKSTEAYDRGTKAESYRQVSSLRAYVFVAQDRPHVEIFERNGDMWELRDATGIDAALKIASLGIEIPLAQIYYAIDFGSSESPLAS